MANGAVYTSNNAGIFSFSGSPTNGGPYIDYTINNNVPTNIASVEMVVKIKSFSGMLFGWTSFDVYLNGTRIGFNTANSDQYGLSTTAVNSLGISNRWKHMVFEMVGNTSAASNPYTNNKIYINAESQPLEQLTGTQSGSTKSFSAAGRISGWRNDQNYKANMDVGIFRIYNRILDPAEIKRHFEAIRGRYGI
jgi:hypothetical protein